jgi:hypothetical protein
MEIQAIGRKIAFHSGFIMNEIAKRSFSIHPLGSACICPLSQGLVCALRESFAFFALQVFQSMHSPESNFVFH